jgi:hypothetical protein
MVAPLMAGRDERIAANEARARLENEERGDWFRTHGRVVFACECFEDDCPAMVSLSREEYEHVRSSPTMFAVHAGHVAPDVEEVAERHDSHWVIEKSTPDGRRVAEELDPRSD